MADIKLTFQNETATINIAPKPQASLIVDSTAEADKIIINYPTNIQPDVIINNPEEQVQADMTPTTEGFIITYPEPKKEGPQGPPGNTNVFIQETQPVVTGDSLWAEVENGEVKTMWLLTEEDN